MSNIQRFENLKQIVTKQEQDFKKLAAIHNAVHFEREASFAIQLLQDNSYLSTIAYDNPDSLRRAVLNVAAVGLSLSPVHKQAYLVPRDKKVCLDVSYLGLIKLATDIGAIEWAAAEIVKEKDTFFYKGVDEKPHHEFEAFKDRGTIIGAYCLTKLANGGYMTTLMAIDEIYSIRDRSSAWMNSKKGPWATDESEMIKKTLIKRASKSWPKSSRYDRLDQAIDLSNDADEIVFETKAEKIEDDRAPKIAKIIEGLAYLEKDEKKFIAYCARVHKREIKELADMTDIELTQAMSYVEQLVTKKEELEDAAG